MHNTLTILWPFLLGLLSVCGVTSGARAADPRSLGPYPVGVKTTVVVDEARICAITGEKRTLVTEIWYPAAEGADKFPVNKFDEFFVNPAGKLVGAMAIGKFGGKFAELNKSFKNIARRGAKISAGQFPLLVFSHGNGGFRHQNTFQTEYLASHGYIVVACDHTGNAAVSILPDRIVIYDRATIKDMARWDDRPKDVMLLISRFAELNQQEDSWLFGKLADGQCGVLGHSFGGFTACRVAEMDERVKAILPMTVAGTLLDRKETQLSGKAKETADRLELSNKPCKVPMMVLLGDQDRTVKQRGNDRSKNFFARSEGPRYLLNFKDAGHFTFTEILQINPKFGDGVGEEKDDDGEVTFTFSDAAVDQKITNQYSVAFFDTFLKQDSEARKFLDSNQYPEELQYLRE